MWFRHLNHYIVSLKVLIGFRCRAFSFLNSQSCFVLSFGEGKCLTHCDRSWNKRDLWRANERTFERCNWNNIHPRNPPERGREGKSERRRNWEGTLCSIHVCGWTLTQTVCPAWATQRTNWTPNATFHRIKVPSMVNWTFFKGGKERDILRWAARTRFYSGRSGCVLREKKPKKA